MFELAFDGQYVLKRGMDMRAVYVYHSLFTTCGHTLRVWTADKCDRDDTDGDEERIVCKTVFGVQAYDDQGRIVDPRAALPQLPWPYVQEPRRQWHDCEMTHEMLYDVIFAAMRRGMLQF